MRDSVYDVHHATETGREEKQGGRRWREHEEETRISPWSRKHSRSYSIGAILLLSSRLISPHLRMCSNDNKRISLVNDPTLASNRFTCLAHPSSII